jgi:predicted nucleic acid-binding Zn ribbon protein
MSDPTPLSVVISELIARKGLARVQGNAQLAGIWKAVAGDRISSRTKVLGLKRGALEVAVDNSALLNELSSFHKPALLQQLHKEYAEHRISEIRFKLRTDMRQPGENSGK